MYVCNSIYEGVYVCMRTRVRSCMCIGTPRVHRICMCLVFPLLSYCVGVSTAGTPPSIIGVLPQTGGGGGGGAGGMVDKEQIYQWIQDLSSSESYTREQALMELR